MIIIKYFVILLVLIMCSLIGILYSKKFSGRLKDLEEMKNALNIFEAKIKYTYQPIPEVFKQIAIQIKPNIGNIFLKSSELMGEYSASKAWEESIEIEKANTNFLNSDISIILNLSKMLGNIDLDGQVSSIELTSKFLDKQIEEAQISEIKNKKLYKTLGTGIGLTIAIILC